MSIYHVKARSIDGAVESFCRSMTMARKFKNGRWRWENDYFDSAGHLLAEITDLAYEFHLLHNPSEQEPEVFAGICWLELFYNWNDKDFYMQPRRKVGKCYEWYSPDLEYYALFRSPNYVARKIKKFFDPWVQTAPNKQKHDAGK